MKKILDDIRKLREAVDTIYDRYDDSKLEYKGYYAYVHYDAEFKVLWGIVEGTGDLVDFESDSAVEIENEFRKAVDDYIEVRKKIEEEIRDESVLSVL